MSRMLTYLGLLALTALASDLARVYPSGKELAIGNQTGGTVAVNGKELATSGNSGLAHSQAPGQELTKLSVFGDEVKP